MDEGAVERDRRETEILWLQKNEKSLWKRYPGKWIAVQGEELVAVGDSLSEVLEAARAAGHENPLVDAVRRTEYQGVKLIRRA